jgi:hypothetical protein
MRQLPKLLRGVRFPLPAPAPPLSLANCARFDDLGPGLSLPDFSCIPASSCHKIPAVLRGVSATGKPESVGLPESAGGHSPFALPMGAFLLTTSALSPSAPAMENSRRFRRPTDFRVTVSCRWGRQSVGFKIRCRPSYCLFTFSRRAQLLRSYDQVSFGVGGVFKAANLAAPSWGAW